MKKSIQIPSPLILLMLIMMGNSTNAQNTLASDPFQALQFNIGNAKVVALGEDGHGFETYNQAKIKIFSFLYQKLGYRKLIVESSFTECVMSFLKNPSLEQRFQYFIYPFWNTVSVRDGLRPLYEEEKSTGEPFIFGCDVQEDCRFVSLADHLLQNGWVKEKKAQLLASDSLLSFFIGKKNSRNYPSQQEYHLLLSHYNDVLSEVANHQHITPLQRKLVMRSLENRKWLCYYLTIKSGKERMHFRDSLMADNVNWLLKELPGPDKFVLWTTNLHAASLKAATRSPQWMGERLSSALGENYYPIAFKKKSILTSGILHFDDGSAITFHQNEPSFSATVYCETITKIKKEEWITRCE